MLWTDASGRQEASFCGSNLAAPGTGIFLENDGRLSSTTLQTPVQGEGISFNSSGNAPSIFAATFAW